MKPVTKKIGSVMPRSRGSWKCDSKKQYVWLRDAIGAADGYMDRIAITRGPMMPYYCSRHSCWHTGHNSRASLETANTYSSHCVARERLRKEIAFLSDVIFDIEDGADESRYESGFW